MKILGNGLVPEAVSVAAFKAAVPMADVPEFNTGIAAQLRAATETVEAATHRPMGLRSVEILPPVTAVGWCRWWFPVAPVVAVTEVAVWTAGAWLALPGTDFSLEQAFDEPQLVLGDAVRQVYDAAAVRVRAQVGHDVVPDRLKQAVILIAHEWHLAGSGVGDAMADVRSFAAHALIRQVRYIRPGVVA